MHIHYSIQFHRLEVTIRRDLGTNYISESFSQSRTRVELKSLTNSNSVILTKSAFSLLSYGTDTELNDTEH